MTQKIALILFTPPPPPPKKNKTKRNKVAAILHNLKNDTKICSKIGFC